MRVEGSRFQGHCVLGGLGGLVVSSVFSVKVYTFCTS